MYIKHNKGCAFVKLFFSLIYAYVYVLSYDIIRGCIKKWWPSYIGLFVTMYSLLLTASNFGQVIYYLT